MQVPKHVRIGGHDIKVDVLPREKVKGDGSLTYVTNQMRVADDMCQSQQASTILHECLHAAFFTSNLRNVYKFKDEETIVSSLESLLFAWIKDNPKLITFIQKAG